MNQPIKVVSVMEAHSVTGPAKNLLEFARRSAQAYPDLPAVEFTIVGYRRGDAAESPFLTAARAAGLAVEIIQEKGRFDASVPGQMQRIVAARDPHIVQTHNTKSHFFMKIAGIGRSRKWLAFHHGYTNEDWKTRIYNLTSRWSLRGAYRVVTVCRPFVDQLVERGVARDSVLVRPNSVRPFVRPEEASLEATRAEIGLREGEGLVVAIGRLSQEKGHADLLDAFAQLKDPNVRLALVGEGPEWERLEQQRARLGLDGRVMFAGQKSDVRSYYALADVFVLPSHSEGSPNVLLEAMAAGCPIVATRVGGVPDTVTDGVTALLIPAAAPQGMAQAMERLLVDRELSRGMAAAARQVAETEFSPDEYCRAMIRIYCQVLGRPV